MATVKFKDLPICTIFFVNGVEHEKRSTRTAKQPLEHGDSTYWFKANEEVEISETMNAQIKNGEFI